MIDIINKIDPKLNYIGQFKSSSLEVYHVTYDVDTENYEMSYVLKIAKRSDDWRNNHLRAEKEVLKYVKNIPGITRLAKDYGIINKRIMAILKEYYPGETIEILGKLTDNSLYAKLEHTVRLIHSEGIARLDLAARNVVISPDKSGICLIDVGHGLFAKNLDPRMFEHYCYRDMSDLEKLTR